jgi:RNA 2',3'-cyclic 3'-phosphodiesterase
MASDAERFRTFIALSLPDVVKDAIHQAQGKLQAAVRSSAVRWTKPEQFHLTLKFLGYVPAPQVPGLIDQLESIGPDFHAIPLEAARLGSFPAGGAPRVVWVGVHDCSGALLRLQAAIDHVTTQFGREERAFSGHITLARVKDISRSEASFLKERLAKGQEMSFGSWTATQFELMRSVVSSQGSTYSSLASIALQAAG